MIVSFFADVNHSIWSVENIYLNSSSLPVQNLENVRHKMIVFVSSLLHSYFAFALLLVSRISKQWGAVFINVRSIEVKSDLASICFYLVYTKTQINHRVYVFIIFNISC